MKNKIIILAVSIAIFLPSLVLADLLIPGQKSISSCHRIVNLSDYPDHVFLFYGRPVTGFGVIEPDDCLSFYKLSQNTIYAIAKEDFDQNELDTKQDLYFQENPKLIPSDAELDPYSPISSGSTLTDVEITWEIKGVDTEKLEIKKTKVIYTYKDGTTEELQADPDGNLPPPLKKQEKSWLFFPLVFGLPLVAIIIIVIIILKKRKK